eukprot:RCo028078
MPPGIRTLVPVRENSSDQLSVAHSQAHARPDSDRSLGPSAFSGMSLRGDLRRKRQKRGLRLPLKVVIMVSMCLFTVGPAIALWMVSWQTGNNGINSINRRGQSSVEDVAVGFRRATMRSTESAFMDLIQPTEDLILTESCRLKGSVLLSYSGPGAVLNYTSILDRMAIFYDMRASRHLSTITYELYLLPSVSYPQMKTTLKVQWTSFPRMNVNALLGTNDPTIYIGESVLNEDLNATVLRLYWPDQVSGERLFPMFEQHVVVETASLDITQPEFFAWENELYFNSYTGLPELVLDYAVPTTDMSASHRLYHHTSAYTVSSFLLGLLDGTKQRLFVNFRTPAGTLIGASHGKYFSHSNVDYSSNNPLLNPPPVAEFLRYTPINSTDPTIYAAAGWLLESFTSWEVIPELDTVLLLNGEEYWLNTAAIVTKMDLRVSLVLLVDRGSTMGPIEAKTASTLSDISRTNNQMTIIFAVVVLLALLFALLISWLLTASLSRLAL